MNNISERFRYSEELGRYRPQHAVDAKDSLEQLEH